MPVSKAFQQIEPLGRVDILGHSLAAEGGASQLDFGSMHKYAALFPARFRNIAVGGAIAAYPGILGPLDTSSGATGGTGRGWNWVATNEPNNERQKGPGAAAGINTTLTANTSIGAQNNVAVAASAGGAGYQWAIVGRGSSAELAMLSGTPDGTHVNFVNPLANAHTSGEQVYAFPDAHIANRQFGLIEFSWNDMAKLGPTEYQVSTKHALRTIWAIYRQFARFNADSVTIRQTGTGAWTRFADTANAIDGVYLSNALITGTLTIDVPPTFRAGEVIDLHFLSAVNGNGALWTINVDSGGSYSLNGGAAAANQTFEARDQQAINYGSTHASPTNGQTTCCTARISGLAAGAHTIVLTPGTIKGSALFSGWGIEPPQPPTIMVPQPARFPNYTLYSGDTTTWPYGGTIGDSDAATIKTVNNALIAEFGNNIFSFDVDSILNKNARYWTYDSAHLNDEGHSIKVTAAAKALRQKNVQLEALVVPSVSDRRGWYPVLPSGTSVAGGQLGVFLNSWQNYGTAGYPVAQYYKDIATGLVYVQGAVKNTTAANAGLAILALPNGHRPTSFLQFDCVTSLGPGSLEVDTTGNIYIIAGYTTNFVAFDFVFPADS